MNKPRAACASDPNPNRWFSKARVNVEYAKRVCKTCPIATACLTETLEYESFAGERLQGIFGALTPAERTNLTTRKGSS